MDIIKKKRFIKHRPCRRIVMNLINEMGGMRMTSSKAQASSMDVIIAVVLFIATFFIIFILATNTTKNLIPQMQEEAEVISNLAVTDNSTLDIITDESLNETKIAELAEREYEDLKKETRVERDFCIYFEDEDGNILNISNITGIGSPDINITGTPCR